MKYVTRVGGVIGGVGVIEWVSRVWEVSVSTAHSQNQPITKEKHSRHTYKVPTQLQTA